jgi:hypothetical protein
MKSIYLDSVVISYYTARLSSDIMVLSEQLKTKVFWTTAINKYKIFISNLVRYEIAKGDPEASAKRIEAKPLLHRRREHARACKQTSRQE